MLLVVMPKYFEFVFSAYGFWILTFAVYMALLARREARARRALERLQSPPRPE